MAREENDTTDPSHVKDIPHERPGDRPDYSKPLPRKPLPAALQKELDDAENDSWASIYDGTGPESTDTSLRYAAYANRVRTIMLSAQRYVAYTSDIGESFRPIAHPYLVKGAYAVSWLYLAGDVSHEGYKAWIRNQRVLYPEKYTDEHKKQQQGQEGVTGQVNGAVSRVKDAMHEAKATLAPSDSADALVQPPGKIVPIEDYKAVMAQRAVFQSIASMGLPAFTIHSIVRYSGQAFKSVKNPRIRTWGPIGLGLAAVPALPFLFDHPVEQATEWVFYKGFELVGGPEAVGKRPETGRESLLTFEGRKASGKEKEKEL